jgi:curved DNA-binding protein CbpA
MVDSGRGCPYEVLGVKRTASKEEVKAAFRDQAMRCHPDRHTHPAQPPSPHLPPQLSLSSSDTHLLRRCVCRDPSPQAVARFVEIRAAAEALLHGVRTTYRRLSIIGLR